ncbi:MAG TPA: DegT/DnrJ/EryC1/StrS family aminotransferase [Candidatus Paceibacterota bacterium]
MKVPYVNLKLPDSTLRKEIFKALTKVFEKGDFILGQEVQKLEKQFAEYCGTKYAVGVNSGTDALFLAMKALRIGRGHEVITTPNTFLATASAIIAVGAKPVFVDVREDMNINPDLIEEKITKKTKAIIPVHLAGKPADMKPIMAIAKKHNLYVIEDAAQSVGAEYRSKKIGSFGIVNCFSLHPLKTLNASGDGGLITTNDDSIYRHLLEIRNIGLKNRSESDYWGHNSRLDSLQAAIVNVKLKYLNQWIQQRRENAAYYQKHLSDIVFCPQENNQEKSAYHLFVIQTPERDKLQSYLIKNDIETKIHYPVPIHLQACSKELGYAKGDFPVAEKQSQTILSLPIHQALNRSQLDYVIEKTLKFF